MERGKERMSVITPFKNDDMLARWQSASESCSFKKRGALKQLSPVSLWLKWMTYFLFIQMSIEKIPETSGQERKLYINALN